jgi:hypothetical protein
MTGHVALSSGPGSAYSDYACLIGFGSSGYIDVRNGSGYSADVQVPYTAGQTYHFRLVVDIPSHTYSVYVTPQGSGEQTLAANYAFRTEQNSVASLGNWVSLPAQAPTL